MMEKIPLLGMSMPQLSAVAAECGMRPFNARQMARWLYVSRVCDIDRMTDLSKQARARLGEKYCVGRTSPLSVMRSADGTVKYLFEGAGGCDVESVMIPDGERATLCVSSQAGCRMGCKFCMTGRQGFHGNLTAAQIMNQVLGIENSSSLTNIVFMGMGEPTDNLEAVIQAIDVLTAPWGLAWSPKRITVSTVGNVKALKALMERTKVHIAVSLHSPYERERAELMPVERAWPTHSILSVLHEGDFRHQRRLSFEYILFEGINDTPQHAEALARLVRGLDARVNLIRFHPIPDAPYMSPSERSITSFRDRLNAAGVTATIRASRGKDIMAACGQLAGARDSIS